LPSYTNLNKLYKISLTFAAAAGLIAYTRYSRREVQRLRQGSRMVETSCGPVEAAEIGRGDPVLVVQGSTGGYNLGLYLAWEETGYHYIVPSRPGFLRTPLKNAVTPEQQADLLASLLDSLKIQQAPVIALSGCGPQVFQLALRHPERVSALILISVASQSIPLFVLIPRIIWALLRYTPLLPGLLLNRLPENKFVHPQQKDAIQRSPDRMDELRRLITAVFPAAPRLPGMLNDLYWMVKNPEYPIEKITAPTLVIHGDRDLVVPLEQAHYTANKIPGAELLVIPGGAHLAFAVFQDEVKKYILHFLNRCEKGNYLQEHYIRDEPRL
jgi:pimeloyl-ACP methyl ester carboxylesterase